VSYCIWSPGNTTDVYHMDIQYMYRVTIEFPSYVPTGNTYVPIFNTGRATILLMDGGGR
jgi:hypothetical protein